MVRNSKLTDQPCQIWYARRPEQEEARSKLQFLATKPLVSIQFEAIKPSKFHNWLDIPENTWGDLLPLVSKNVKLGKETQGVIARYYSGGSKTNRDDWAVDVSATNLERKMRSFTRFFNDYQFQSEYDTHIKWSRDLKIKYQRGNREDFSSKQIIDTLYRPYCHFFMYDSPLFVDVRGITDEIYLPDNIAICISGSPLSKPFQCLATKLIPAYDMLEKTQCFTFYKHDQSWQSPRQHYRLGAGAVP